MEGTSAERLRQVIDLDNDEDNEDDLATRRGGDADAPLPKRRRNEGDEGNEEGSEIEFRNLFQRRTATIHLPRSTGGIPSGMTGQDVFDQRRGIEDWIHKLIRVNKVTEFICDETPSKTMKMSTMYFLHWLIENKELMKPIDRMIHNPDVREHDEAIALEENDREIAKAYLEYMACSLPWSVKEAENCVRACHMILPTGPNRVERQRDELFAIEHELYANMVLGNEPGLLFALKRLRVMSSGRERPGNITDLSESEWLSSLRRNQKTARHLLTDVAECLWTENQFLLALQAFHYADNANRMMDCVTRLQSAAANNLCSVCMSDTVSLVFHRCNHATTCHACYENMKSRGRRVACPICKRTVESATAVNVQGVSQ